MILSPLAPAFEPASSQYHDATTTTPSPFAIFNNGTPSMIIKEGNERQILNGIDDDYLDLMFPPTAEDVAELEEMEHFVQTMAMLSLLEEHEQKARENFAHIFKKRFESRRADGLLTGKRPLSARGSIIRKDHNSNISVSSSSSSTYDGDSVHSGSTSNTNGMNEIVVRHFSNKVIENKARFHKGDKKKTPFVSKHAKSAFISIKPIQQPRKHY
eukprot:CAMPEP_0178959156 /NCGR_PEP_ID=MMETSP0789-20121207/12105_1 /TAXON_ID=3005 /ORGANISM="Rhizosolenia setigera, Strain CCMP 1694" /LENGTH=213 /DNA_ID=CAMNT_0020642069 /DNA_START=34 /DNA_END=675 /DNA_ORIENTATION=+